MTRGQFVTLLRDDREPTRLALAMSEAVLQHLVDVHEDDPGDSDDPRWQSAFDAAQRLVADLRGLIQAGER